MVVKFLKTGADSVQLQKKEQAAVEQRKSQQGKTWRFWLKENEEAQITFVDGALSPEGFLLPPRFYEHQLMLNGSWQNYFVCPQESNPGTGEKCPICEGGDRPSLIALFTVIDHRVHTGRDGKIFKDNPRLMVAKNISYELLNKIAQKRGGLAGATFDASRVGDKAPSIGSHFDFVEKNDVDQLKTKYMREFEDPKTKQKTMRSLFVPLDYEQEIDYFSGDQLREMGLGGAAGNMTAPKVPTAGQMGAGGPKLPSPDQTDYSASL